MPPSLSLDPHPGSGHTAPHLHVLTPQPHAFRLSPHPTSLRTPTLTLTRCLLSGVDRDCLAGWGCTVTVLTKDGATIRQLKGRMD